MGKELAMLRIKILKAHCLGGGRDVQVDEVLSVPADLTLAEAHYKISKGYAQAVPEEVAPVELGNDAEEAGAAADSADESAPEDSPEEDAGPGSEEGEPGEPEKEERGTEVKQRDPDADHRDPPVKGGGKKATGKKAGGKKS